MEEKLPNSLMKFPKDQGPPQQVQDGSGPDNDPHTDLLSEDSNDLSIVFRFHVPILRR